MQHEIRQFKLIIMRLMLCLFFLVFSTNMVNAQSTRDSVITAVNNLFEAMKNAKTVLLKNCFSPNAVLQTIRHNNDDAEVISESVADFIEFVGKETIGAADEQIVIETVKIDAALAMVWTPYKFFYKGKFSHCGVNCFQLVRLNKGWRIQYIIDTRRKEGCL